MKKVVLGFSGGVDSAVCARLLMDAGFEVHGLYMDNTDERSLADAVNTAKFIGIPLEVRDVHRELDERVCSRFAESYLRGETPNPCIICNPALKFKTLLDFADKIGADNIATGHYARAENGVLYKGMPSNDQSYMLCRIRREQLSRLTLPLGRLEKTQVRRLAESFGLRWRTSPTAWRYALYPTRITYRGSRREPASPCRKLCFPRRGHRPSRGHIPLHRRPAPPGLYNERKLYISAINAEKNEIEARPLGGAFQDRGQGARLQLAVRDPK